MKNFDKNRFDEIFRTGLTSPDLSEIDEDWDLMKARLQNDKTRNKLTYYMIFATSVAAMLLLVSLMVFNSNESIIEKESLKANSHKAESSIVPKDIISGVIPAKSTAGYASVNSESNNEIVYYSNSSNPQVAAAERDQNSTIASTTNTILAVNSVDTTSTSLLLATRVVLSTDVSHSVMENVNVVEKPVLPDQASSIEDRESQKSNSSKSRFSLAVNFAPDLNGVEQFQSNKISYSIGAGLIYSISRKLSVEAGAAYGRKNYQTGFSSFRPVHNLFQVKPNVVSSGFDVMDIQLNLAYTLMSRGKSSIGFGAGVSSYLMLDEQYSFTYQNMNARGLSSFRTGYQNNHFLGIANLSLSYKRNITNNVKLALNPYLKLPLTDLGYGNIRLRSAGMSIGVITNLNKSKK